MSTTLEWCDMCNVATEFEAHPTTPYAIVCAWCGHHRIERIRPVGPHDDVSGGDR